MIQSQLLIFLDLETLFDEYHVTYDSQKEDASNIHVNNNKIVKFEHSSDSLYYYNLPMEYKETVKQENENDDKHQYITTVAENRGNYSTQNFERAKVARKLYHNIGAPTVKNFKSLLKGNMIKNCPVAIRDVDIAEDVWGKDIAYLKNKTTRQQTPFT